MQHIRARQHRVMCRAVAQFDGRLVRQQPDHARVAEDRRRCIDKRTVGIGAQRRLIGAAQDVASSLQRKDAKVYFLCASASLRFCVEIFPQHPPNSCGLPQCLRVSLVIPPDSAPPAARLDPHRLSLR